MPRKMGVMIVEIALPVYIEQLSNQKISENVTTITNRYSEKEYWKELLKVFGLLRQDILFCSEWSLKKVMFITSN